MAHWSEKYIGRRYVDGEFDCGDLARLVQREVFGREIRLPRERPHLEKQGHHRFQAMAEQIRAELPNCCEPTAAPREGDAVLLVTRGYRQHIGIYFEIGEAWVLHAADNAMQVVCQRIRELPTRGLKVEGYYRWI